MFGVIVGDFNALAVYLNNFTLALYALMHDFYAPIFDILHLPF